MKTYAIMRKDLPNLYMQGCEPNEKYCPTSRAPTMGRRHDASEYKTIWDTTPKYFERHTLCGYVDALLEEFRWNSREPFDFCVTSK